MIKSEVFHNIKYVKITAKTLDEIFDMTLKYMDNQKSYKFFIPPRINLDGLTDKYKIELYFVPKER